MSAYAIASVTIHELGHIVAVWLSGGKIRKINFTFFGAEIYYGGSMSYVNDIVIGAAGPLTNMCVAIMVAAAPDFKYFDSELFSGFNLFYAIVNLVPVSVTDGGRILKAVLSLAVEETLAEKTFWALNVVFTAVIDVIGVILLLYYTNPTLIICGILITRNVNFKTSTTNSIREIDKKLSK